MDRGSFPGNEELKSAFNCSLPFSIDINVAGAALRIPLHARIAWTGKYLSVPNSIQFIA
jgi:hypothetical protein